MVQREVSLSKGFKILLSSLFFIFSGIAVYHYLIENGAQGIAAEHEEVKETEKNLSTKPLAEPPKSLNTKLSQSQPKPLPPRPPQPLRPDLTEAQQKQVDEIMKKYQPKIQPLLSKLQATAQELQELMMSSDLTNEDKIRQKHNELLQLEPEFKRLQLEASLEIRRIVNKK